ncbi:sulfurtransferase complex subunit TusB [Thalassotalea piscium]|uniref:tRNA 2-thiouridine synthesizing protein B n=1 Tax=Thalassotalea piscium TaxID=1230533 RepID=A0A7X0NFA1_9GAMM|nr:sulfurtransferase complex subunit TusB [Thalassotalea piscium]MBB6542315.1 tRNA 2-thiouridine synthesizing protein B [Thalassotalea piscium]
MTTLHLIRDSVLINNTITLALTNLAPDDVIVLLDDGCYNVNQDFIKEIQIKVPYTQCFAIEPHMRARSLPTTNLNLISYSDLLDLLFNHNNVITWQ